MRELVKFDQEKYNSQVKALEALIPQIEYLRSQASEIVGKEVISLTGESEVNAFLNLKEFPKATKETASDLLGVKSKYTSFLANLRGLLPIDEYCINSEKKVSIKPEKIEEIKEMNSLYLEGEKLKQYKALLKIANAIGEANKILPNPIAPILIGQDYKGRPFVNLAKFLSIDTRV